ncbi:MAG: hypothetical protein IPM54_32900 [Polyangiaceae bacterium]|nr:hypothetical protein [Polyangiaceae bacterium]
MDGFIDSNASRGRASRRATLLLALSLTAGSFGCSSVISEYDVDADFTVSPKVDGTFFWWNEITLESDVNSYGSARLGFVRLDAAPPAEDLTFLSSVFGEAVTSKERTPIVKQDGFPKNEPNVILDLLHEGDVRPFFEDGHKVRIEWTGKTNPSFLAWPPGGIKIAVKARLILDE